MKNVSAAIIFQENKVLLTRRASGEKLAGYWEFPGGKQEKNESLFQCLEREIFEELNLRCEAKQVLAESVYHYEGGAIKLIAVIAEIISGEIRLSVHDRCQWVPVDELDRFKLSPADIPIAQYLTEAFYQHVSSS